MRKIIVGEFMTLDGVMEGPGPSDDFALAGWTMPYWDDEIGQAIDESAMSSDAMLLGRVTYQAFAAAFAGMPEDNPDGARMNNFPKYVASTTLDTVDWKNSTLIKGDVAEEVAKLKEQPGKNIMISGSGQLVHYLLEHDLIDEFQLLVYPVVLGQGKRLFPDGFNTTFQLTNTKVTKSGVVMLTYVRDRGE